MKEADAPRVRRLSVAKEDAGFWIALVAAIVGIPASFVGGRPFTTLAALLGLALLIAFLLARVLRLRLRNRKVELVIAVAGFFLPLFLVTVLAIAPVTRSTILSWLGFPFDLTPRFDAPQLASSDASTRITMVIVNESETPRSYTSLRVHAGLHPSLRQRTASPQEPSCAVGDALYELSDMAVVSSGTAERVSRITGKVSVRSIEREDSAPLSEAASGMLRQPISGEAFVAACEHDFSYVLLEAPVSIQVQPRSTTKFFLQIPSGDLRDALEGLWATEDAQVHLSGEAGDLDACISAGRMGEC